MTWLQWLWVSSPVGTLVIFAIVYVLGFWSGRVTAQVDRKRSLDREGGFTRRRSDRARNDS
jgi:hypothetical protein